MTRPKEIGSYLFDHNRDNGMSRKSLISYWVVGGITLFNGIIYLLNALKDEALHADFFLGLFIVSCIVISSLIYYTRRNSRSHHYLSIQNDVMTYRWGPFMNEKQKHLKDLSYTISTSNELIFRFVDGHEIIIDSAKLTTHPTKYTELKSFIKTYIDEKKGQKI